MLDYSNFIFQGYITMVKCANPDCQYTFVDILEKGDSVFVRIDTEIGKRSMLLCHVCAEALLKEWTNSD